MSSTTRLLVLGVVRIFQPVHGYEVRRELITWRVSEWASIKPGSVYNALKTLTREGFLEVVGTDQVGGRPERTTYQLTAAGMEEFRALLREEWWTVRMPNDPLMAAISFLDAISREEAIAALEHRVTQIHGIVRGFTFGIEEHDGVESPHHVRELMRLMNARILAEVDWAHQFLARLRAGEYSTLGDPPWMPASELAKLQQAGKSGKPAAPGAKGRPANAGRPNPPRPPGPRSPTKSTIATRAASTANAATVASARATGAAAPPGPSGDRRNGRPRSGDAAARRATRRTLARKRGRPRRA